MALAPSRTNGLSTAPERVAAALRDELLDGAHPVGTRLREEELAERFDVGRHTIRAALRLLVENSLVVHERHRGAVVAPLTKRRIDEVFDYRKILELGALRVALAAGADLTPVRAAVQRLEELARRSPNPSWRDLTAAHSAVHRAIVAAAGNSHVLSAYHRCEDEVRLLLTFVRPDFDAVRLAALHRELVERLELGGEAAVEALDEDIEHGGRAALLAALRRAEDAARMLGR
ncbi:GntR family transcriptional regulator [Kutzneria viridogrisea]|uniref:HTH gntR-type domain-containing protein n=2 Tax=Kutzneria TaxID=43356 RepID=W5W896_9PSEU|nr:GntR family transcriptional regulator [Kutzneria albida]AHH97363.1 hypothetical protein KALB_3999 [Kutzneria albida DSM 43870]MBA8930719.1 DNA-binding GntR family transcriptional regulator [Kutzneria viridogrisea]